MKKNKVFYAVIALVACLAVGFGVNAYSGGQAPKMVIEGDYTGNYIEAGGDEDMGANPGPDKYQRQYFHSGFQSGSDLYATSSTASAYTLTNAELGGDKDYIEWNAGLNITLTSPASTTMPWLGNRAGDKRTYQVYSATTTTAATITYAAGTGVDLQEGEGLTVVQNGLEDAFVTFTRRSTGDVSMIVDVKQLAD